MGNLLLSALVVVVMLGGPLTLYVVIVVLNRTFGGLSVRFVRTPENPLSLMVAWDNESFEVKIVRVKLEFTELVPGGRSLAHSFTFDDSSSQKKTFVLALKLKPEEIEMLTDEGLPGQARALKQSAVAVELETLDGETQRFKVAKTKLLKQLASTPTIDKDAEIITDKESDSWSVQTRVFPWKKKEEVEAEEAVPGGHAPKAAGAPAVRGPVDFAVTKVWIEPGCIVCDACEAEAPLVFWVTGDTCIIRENAPLDDAAAIKAAAEGCPVDVIKYTKVPKPAAATPA